MGRGRIAILVLSAGLTAAPAACNDSAPANPIGMGDNLTVDVDATVQPDQPPAEGGGAKGPFDPGADGGYYATSIDGYAPLNWCSQCGCPSGSYCFGGGTGYTTFDGVCNHLEAGPNPPLAIGCNPPPSGCDASDCVCLFGALAPLKGCYPECVGTKTPSVFCMSP